MCMSVCKRECMCVWYVSVCSAHRGQKRVSDSLNWSYMSCELSNMGVRH